MKPKPLYPRLALFVSLCLLITMLVGPACSPFAQTAPSLHATPRNGIIAATDPEDAQLVRPALQNPIQDRVFYFVMPDRFSNGTPNNDVGDDPGGTTEADILRHGYLPTDKGYYHGGDLKGLTGKLDYLQGMGVNAIWMTPIFKNKPTQDDPSDFGGKSAAYHGYWITDFTQIDPHLGTNAELKTLIDAAHAKGMKVFFDIITNHTADVIQYAEQKYGYIGKDSIPYKDADGNAFDDRDFVGTDHFPPLDKNISFPYHPVFANASDATVKKPDWLNNPIYYHNRGNSTFSGENSIYGDFFGLDDLFTENPTVAQGMTDVYKTWISDFGIDGYRIDTVKHVNIEFWQKFSTEIGQYAKEHGKPDFFMYGEVFDSNPAFMSSFTTEGKLPATLDFGFQSSARSFASSTGYGDNLRDFFANDDYYTDADSNAYALPTFLGNHDMGRIGYFLKNDAPAASADELLARDKLAHALMYFSRGMPVVYYGDEQGFTGDGGDKDARQDMFPSQVASYNDDSLIGTSASTAADNFNPQHPLYQSLKELSDLRGANVALQRGAQIHRYSTGSTGIYAFSRIDRDERIEYIVAVNNANTAQTASFATFTPNATFNQIYPPAGAAPPSDANGQVSITVPAFGAAVYKASTAIPASSAAPEITISAPAADSQVSGRVEVGANLSTNSYAEVTFAVKPEGASEYTVIGTDTNAPFRVFYDVSKVAPGTQLTFKAIVNDLSGHLNSTTTTVRVTGSSGAVCPPPDYAIIHYNRPAGDYTGWGLHLWGDAIDPSEATEWATPKLPNGQDQYGVFWFIKLKDGTKPVNFIIHKGDEKDTPNDRALDPATSPEIWLKQGDANNYPSPTAALGMIRVHYNRPASDYTGWGLHLWGDAIDLSEATEWATPKQPTGTDSYGVYFDVKIKDASKPVNFIIHNGDTKDTPNDRSLDPSKSSDFWLKQGDGTTYTTRAGAENVAIIHYNRPAGDYGDSTSANFNDYWGLHVWTGALNPNPSWQEPIKPAGTDAFGVYFRVPLANGATKLNYIIHRGDAKDQATDQELDLVKYGNEIWIVQGRAEYLLPRVTECVASDSSITPAAGGGFISADGSVSVSFPAGSVPMTATLTYEKLPTPTTPLTYNLELVRAFRLTALDSNGVPISEFAQPYTMVISYTDAYLNAAGVEDEAAMHLLVLRNGVWVPLPDSAVQIDAANNRIVVTGTSLGEFALVTQRRYDIYMPVVAKQ